MEPSLELILIICEGKTESLYFSILQKSFRLPAWVKILSDPDGEEYKSLGQHEALFKNAAKQRQILSKELSINEASIETWAVCDRGNYTGSYTKLRDKAASLNILLAFSDPQIENYLLQHFSPNKSKAAKETVAEELSQYIAQTQPDKPLYKKNDLSWLEDLIDQKHSIVITAIKNADIHTNHAKQPFFTIQRLVERLLSLAK